MFPRKRARTAGKPWLAACHPNCCKLSPSDPERSSPVWADLVRAHTSFANSIQHCRGSIILFRDFPRLVRTSAAFSLHSVQLYIGDVEVEHGQQSPGVCFELPRQGWPLRKVATLTLAEARRFVAFLIGLESFVLPSTFVFSPEIDPIEWEVREYRNAWHGRGGFVGYLHASWNIGQVNRPKVIITRDSASKLRELVEEIDFDAN